MTAVTRDANVSGCPRRVLFATVDSNWAGAQTQMLELAAGLDRAEFEPVVLTTGDGGLVARSRAAGIPTHVLRYGLMRRHFPFLSYYTLGPVALRALLHRERIAIVHTHCPNSAVPIMQAGRGLNLPLAAHIHDFDQRWVTPRTLPVQNRRRTMVVAVSDAIARYAVDCGVERARVRRIYNGIHLPTLPADARARARRELKIDEGEIAVGLVGRLVPRKGAADLIRAMAAPELAGVSARAFLIGDSDKNDDFVAELRRLVDELRLEERIVFVGPHGAAAALHAGFDVAAVPARREAFGRIVIEAMHAGVPVVAYREAALPELVRDELDGILVESGDISALARAIARLAERPSLRTRLGASGRERAQGFGHEQFVRNITSLYRELLAGKEASGE
jgi:glycosyltransferase involved in cell wall biosynthesis